MPPKASSRDLSLPDVKLLWMLSAGLCAFPDCLIRCYAEATPNDPARPLGEQAHIVAHSNTGPRADPSYPSALRSSYDNLVLLCPTHHTQVDKQPNSFSVDDLRKWKSALERRVRERLGVAAADASFIELEQICRYLLRSASEPATNFHTLPPKQKMQHNSITFRLEGFLQVGIAGAATVERYINNMAVIEEDFPERLKAGFLREYEIRFNQDERGDTLFSSLIRFAQGGDEGFERLGAGLSVLGYLFIKCEVFDS